MTALLPQLNICCRATPPEPPLPALLQRTRTLATAGTAGPVGAELRSNDSRFRAMPLDQQCALRQAAGPFVLSVLP